jgi:hypothetical protein
MRIDTMPSRIRWAARPLRGAGGPAFYGLPISYRRVPCGPSGPPLVPPCQGRVAPSLLTPGGALIQVRIPAKDAAEAGPLRRPDRDPGA